MTPCSFKYKLGMFLAFGAAYWGFYVYPNLFATAEPHLLPMLWIDQNTPFLPWTFLIYTSDYTVFLFVILMHQTKEGFNSVSRMCFATLFICGLFFMFFPTTYIRPDYPQDQGFLIQALMSLVSFADSPRNCFPSMHVALTGVATWSLRNFPKKIFGVFVIWSLLIFASTLTTKQHYFMDIVGGIGVIVLVAFLEGLYQKKPFFRSPLKFA